MQRRMTLLGVAVVALSAATALAQTPAAQGRGGGSGPAATPASCGPTPPVEWKNVVQGSRCFELRTYTVKPEGPGSVDLLHARFREWTVPLLKKHGAELVGFWQPVAKPDTLVYLLAFKDAATRDAVWAAFFADPDWVKARTAMQVAVSVQSEFLIATDYGPMK